MRFALCEFFHAAIDFPIFRPELDEYADQLVVLNLKSITHMNRTEATFASNLMGVPRRLSRSYLLRCAVQWQ
jgi:hypothetical protein